MHFKKLSLIFTLILMVDLHVSSVSDISGLQNRNLFMVHAYQSANSVLKCGNQVCIST